MKRIGGCRGGQEKEGFRASYREADDEHLLGEFARVGGIEAAEWDSPDMIARIRQQIETPPGLKEGTRQ